MRQQSASWVLGLSGLVVGAVSGLSACGTDDETVADRNGYGTVDSGVQFDAAVQGDTGVCTGAGCNTTPDAAIDDFQGCAGEIAKAQPQQAPVNVIWVVDSSGSMDNEAAAVQANMNNFAARIVSAGISDYRVIVISEDGWVKVPNPLGSDTAHFRYINEKVDSDEPLADLLKRYADYQGFLLPNGITHVVAVTDDESSISGSDFVTQMKAKLGHDFFLHAIAAVQSGTPLCILGFCAPAPACAGAARPGAQYFAAAKATMGLEFSVCTEDWSGLFDKLGQAVGVSVALPCELTIPQPPVGEILDLGKVNVLYKAAESALGAAIPAVKDAAGCGTTSGWHYDVAANPTRMILCPASCTAVKQGGSLELKLGCGQVLK